VKSPLRANAISHAKSVGAERQSKLPKIYWNYHREIIVSTVFAAADES
jgi:hypothetical protein